MLESVAFVGLHCVEWNSFCLGVRVRPTLKVVTGKYMREILGELFLANSILPIASILVFYLAHEIVCVYVKSFIFLFDFLFVTAEKLGRPILY